MSASTKQDQHLVASTPKLKDVATYVAPALAIAALVDYSIFALLYDSFYGGLGTSPRDVGLGFKETLAGSTAVALFILIGVSACWGLTIYAIKKRSLAAIILIIVVAVICGVLFALLLRQASRSEPLDAVQAGHAVSPTSIGPIVLVPLHAEPAVVRAVGRPPEQTKAIDDLAARKLLYLGENNGVAVLYDSTEDHVIRVPSAVTVIVATNCESAQSKPECKDANQP